MKSLANEVAKSSNKEIEIAKHKINCLIAVVITTIVLATMIALYSIYSLKQLFYDMQIEENKTTYEQEINSDNGGNAVGIIGDNNEVGK